MKKVAVTGGLSCGKTTVCRFFKDLGAAVLSADQIVHQLLTPETDVGRQVIALIGPEIVSQGKIDRSKISKKVFNHPVLLKSLEALLHPFVAEEIEKHYQACQEVGSAPLFIVEIPLLFETQMQKKFDWTIAVLADPETCWRRYHLSTGYEREEYSRRMARQLMPEKKAEMADYVIRNTGTLETLRAEVETLFETLTNLNEGDQDNNGF